MECLENSEYAEIWGQYFMNYSVEFIWADQYQALALFTRQLIYEQMMEVIGAANALGINGIDESFAQKMLQVTDEMVPYSPSMRLDYDFRRPMEIAYIYSRPIAEARRVGFAMPRLEMLERELLFMDQHLS